MMPRGLCFLLLALISAAGFTGCQPTLQAQRLYDPPPRPSTEVARMWNGWSPFVKVVEVNGRPVHNSIMWGSVIEVLPGTHQITLKSNTKDVEILPWYAQAGKEYEPAVFQNKIQMADNKRNTLSYGRPVIIPVRNKRFLPEVE
jgi:hypothetical protein